MHYVYSLVPYGGLVCFLFRVLFVQAFCSPVYTSYILLGVLLASFLVNIYDLIIHQKTKFNRLA